MTIADPSLDVYGVGSQAVVERLGISYRRLHYLVESRVVPVIAPGQGRPIAWPIDTVERLSVALALEAAASVSSVSQWPRIVAAVVAGAPPPAQGWAVLAAGQVTYATELVELVALLDELSGAVVARLA